MGNRYSRQVGYLGREAQEAIERSSAAVVGCGALGNVASSLLARMNFSRVRLIDSDVVEESNLPRCVLFGQDDVGRKKAGVLEKRLRKIGSDTRIEVMEERLSLRNLKLLDGFDVVVDCTDSMKSRRLINGFCVEKGIPWVYGALTEDEGFVASFRGRPCFSCLFPEGKSPRKDLESNTRIFSPLPAMMGSLQAAQAVRIATGRSRFGGLYHLSLRDMSLRTSVIRPDPHCRACGKR